MTARRCGKPMLRYDTTASRAPDNPVCGRAEGHNGQCRSEEAVKRNTNADRLRAGGPRVCGCGCGQITSGWGPRMHGHNERDSRGAWTMPGRSAA